MFSSYFPCLDFFFIDYIYIYFFLISLYTLKFSDDHITCEPTLCLLVFIPLLILPPTPFAISFTYVISLSCLEFFKGSCFSALSSIFCCLLHSNVFWSISHLYQIKKFKTKCGTLRRI